jgi:hypothetical protein
MYTAAPPPRLPPGTRLNGVFEIDRRIGSGGMGEIYRGRSIETGDPVAIKMMRLDLADNALALALFRKEASALHNIHHEAIIRYYLFSHDPGTGRHYLAMEFVDGLPLSDLVYQGPLAPGAVSMLQPRLAAGLYAVHQHGIIHRDLSPDNVLIPGHDLAQAKIIDFGIARSTRAGDGTIIGSAFAGKYNYVSPEQLGLYGGDVTAKSDIYSLGLVLAACLLGQPLDMGGTQFEVLEKRRVVPDLTAIDRRFRPLLERMLQPDPADRPESMADIAAWRPRKPMSLLLDYPGLTAIGRRFRPRGRMPQPNPAPEFGATPPVRYAESEIPVSLDDPEPDAFLWRKRAATAGYFGGVFVLLAWLSFQSITLHVLLPPWAPAGTTRQYLALPLGLWAVWVSILLSWLIWKAVWKSRLAGLVGVYVIVCSISVWNGYGPAQAALAPFRWAYEPPTSPLHWLVSNEPATLQFLWPPWDGTPYARQVLTLPWPPWVANDVSHEPAPPIHDRPALSLRPKDPVPPLSAPSEPALSPRPKDPMPPAIAPSEKAPAVLSPGPGMMLGLSLAPARNGGAGVVVNQVDPNSLAGDQFQAGDIIFDVNGKVVSSPADVRKAVTDAQNDGKRSILMRVKSIQGIHFVVVAIGNA